MFSFLFIMVYVQVTSTQPVMVPILHDIGVIVNETGVCIRDPTQVIHADGMYHFWATHNPECSDRKEFPRAEIWHYHTTTDNVTGPWNSSGVAVSYGHAGEWDAWSVFTPGAIYDPVAAKWYLWYGAVADGGRPTRESNGLATSSSPFGPWTRSPHNPVFHGNGTVWCGAGESARVDEADAYIIGGVSLVLVKGVCQNFTALPSIWVSIFNSSSFEPPYKMLQGASPMIQSGGTPERKGMEQARLFPGPDGLLHLTGHDHGDNHCSHYTSNGGVMANDWTKQSYMPGMGLSTNEATPVFTDVPGDKGGVPTHFIQFSNDEYKNIHLMKVQWVSQTNM
eukprot:m.342670 g.342670  ORF g.342670 m.342670 type:complete len:337 (+) comp21688_c0_seq1:142-1152(+)